MATFIVNGQEYKLTIIGKNGIDYSNDFIGNTAHGMRHDEEGRYVATTEDLEWWTRVMAEHEEMQTLIDQYVEKYGWDTVHDHLESQGALSVDMDIMLKSVKISLADLDD